ncbi:Bug family tripartite tricarboxylate transporter substrate binding protein [Zwartia vadi]|uniref:Bug family tripartite tricarboxylate transporter substrate binding protein n=1 Tax=Zwartia vadi TaxID=3058168 RepID=UPI0025B557DD|nr:tripartite tricarboxylate transporter substrate binding protein [Zwartia vadi]MDN3987613.1 tripartite tricarboxylate transporter substrate binding protein [Zwartia vadi]
MNNSRTTPFIKTAKWAAGVLSAVALTFGMTGVQAQQAYPNAPIRIVVGYAAGGTTDILARSLGEQLGKILGQTVIVDNKPGAASNIGAAFVAQAKPDGYTLYMATVASHGINPALYRGKMTFDPIKDFAPISLVASIPLMLVVNPNLPAKSIKELVDYAKKNPGKLNYASSGNGSPGHLAAAVFNDATKVEIEHIPFKGGNPANTSVLAGETQMTFATVPGALPHVVSGKLIALGVTTKQRSSQLPDVPTISEAAGLPNYDISTWNALLAPKGTPEAIVTKLNAAIVQAMKSPELRQRFEKEGAMPMTSTPKELSDFIVAEVDRWGKVVDSTPMKSN